MLKWNVPVDEHSELGNAAHNRRLIIGTDPIEEVYLDIVH